MNTAESKYIDKKAYVSRYMNERVLALREAKPPVSEQREEAEWNRFMVKEAKIFIPFLTKKCHIEFRGRILEIGAGGAWLSAELSKLPTVVDLITTDISPRLLKEHAPKTFAILKANRAKITLMPGDFHKLDFPDNYFDYVVCSAVLAHAVNVVQVLREAKRVLKNGGRFVAIREPVLALAELRPRAKRMHKRAALYSLDHYKELFKQAALPLEVKPVNLSSGLKYYLDKMVNRLTHARYVFVGTKRSRSAR
jgi:ubiquinone/menaquinone biosynthesis C-methylase UbiE